MQPIQIAEPATNRQNTAHLSYLLQSPHYTIATLCNSSLTAAYTAISSHNIPPTTKAYASPEDLALDSDIDLVVCSVNVRKHYALIKPALLAGKDVIVEWPLGASLAEAVELAGITKEKAFKEMLEEGRIGKVLSSTMVGACNYYSGVEVTGVEYHGYRVWRQYEIDAVLHVLGEFESFQSMLGIKRPYTKFLNHDGTVKVEALKKTTPDQFMVQGELSSGAFVSSHFRGGYPFPGEPGLLWHICDEKGKVRVSCDDAFLQIGLFDPVLRVLDHETSLVDVVKLPKEEFESLRRENRYIARLYEAFAKEKTRI
ncbi:uncharacterized protein PAC_14710 [Phialocephala subalpina]|uniref:Uncharacterized protein n=1 Tax=Phialocephala subalpina TaxID=576137 RepID=A0A1L7XIF8_9HELO|nr:uncharacterized protein PAC_14710 [Phialocephala subalpina]